MWTVLVRQISAEFIKARKRGLYFGVFTVLLVFAVLPLAVAVAAWRDPNLRVWAAGFVSFPGGLWSSLGNMQRLLPHLSLVVGAGAVGGEYAAGTWKMMLPRTAKRGSALVARFVAAVLLCMAGLWLALAVSLVASALGAALLGLPFVSGGEAVGVRDVLLVHVFFLVQFSINVSIGILAAILTRSLIGGALLGILGTYLIRSGTMLPAGWILPLANLDYLEARWIPQSRLTVSVMESVFGGPVAWQTSLASVLAFTVGFGMLASWLFERRDIASD